jgi:hypothetical protein
MCRWHTVGGKMSDKNLEQQINIKFCVKICKSASETLNLLTVAYGKYAIKKSSVFEWHRRFKAGREHVQDDPRSGQPKTHRTGANVDRVRTFVRSDRRLGVKLIAEELRQMTRNNVDFTLRVCEFLAKKYIAKIDHPPYSPDLAHCDLWIFPKLKNALKGQTFADIPDIQRNVTTLLRGIPENDFQDCFM